jgi:putative PEP-CTERM system histidine kinase
MEAVAAVSHGIAAAAFLGFAAVLLASQRARANQRILITACLLSGCWSLAAGFASGDWRIAADLLDAARVYAWLAFPAFLLAPAGIPVKRLLLPGAFLLCAALVSAELWPATEEQGPVAAIGARLLLAVLGLVLIEMLFRHTPGRERWSMKFACFGVGAMFAYEFYLYSDALLFRRIHPEILAARGLVNALCVPLLAIAAARNPAWQTGLAISRRMALRSVALIGSAAYLLAMAAGGWYLRESGGVWGPLMQMACLTGAALLLAGMLFSGTARAALRVFVARHFFKGGFDYREEWQRFTFSLSTPGINACEQAIQAIAALAESPAGALWLLRDEHFAPAACWGMPRQGAREPAGSPFCELLREPQSIVEAGADGAQPLPQWLDGVPQLWLVVPLMLHGELSGFVVLAKPRVVVPLNWELRELLRIAGSQAASCLAHAELAEKLAVARQFDSFHRMTAFLVHDLKGLLAQQRLLLANAERHRSNPAFQDDMLATLAAGAEKMEGLLRKLRQQPALEGPAAVSLAEVCEEVLRGFSSAHPRPQLRIERGGLLIQAEGARLERVLAHLVQNAVDATPAGGAVTLTLAGDGGNAVVTVADTGTGMSAQFLRERLFRPFETTKDGGMGIGAYEAREYVRGLGGRIEVSSTPGAGSTFRVILPLQSAAVAA